ncbi:MAG: 3-phosphoshikimate 1-carboxyvinyltransferase [Myxococcota bacterium]
MSDRSQATPLPDRLAIEPRGPLDARIRVPGSKSITNRALLIAALADGVSELHGGLESVDTRVMREALEAVGVAIEIPAAGAEGPWQVRGVGGRWSPATAPLWVENSGTTARFLTAALTLAGGPFELDGSPRMRERPIRDLVDALRGLGAEVETLGRGGCPPVAIAGNGLPGGHTVMDARHSSQYVSAVLLAAPCARSDVSLDFIDGTVISRPYVDVTLEVMRDFGAEAGWTAQGGVQVRSERPYVARRYVIEPDASSAAYPFCAAAIAGGSVRVDGVPQGSIQPDFKLLELLERMGCLVLRGLDYVEVRGPSERLHGLGEVDMNDLPDAAMAYAVLALFADRPTRIVNIPNLRIKETDRLAALETELRKLGARAEAGPDWLEISPGPLQGAEIDTYDDHRMAMSFALAGLRVPGVVIRDPGCVSKTWPNFFDVFRHL